MTIDFTELKILQAMKHTLRTLMLFIAVIASLNLVWAQTNKSIDLPLFHTVDISGNIHLILAPSSEDSQSISYEEYGEQVAKLKYEVKKGVLYLTLKTGVIDKNNSARVVVSNSKVTSILSQGAMVETLRPITVDEFTYQSKGSKNIAKLMFDCTTVNIKVTGYCDVLLGGKTHGLNINATSGSRVDALNIEYVELEAKSTLGSEIYAKIQGILSELTASTTGTIYYFGESENVRAKSSFGGDIVYIASTINSSPVATLWDTENQPIKQLDKEPKAIPRKDKESKEEVENRDEEEKPVVRQEVKREERRVVEDDEDFF